MFLTLTLLRSQHTN